MKETEKKRDENPNEFYSRSNPVHPCYRITALWLWNEHTHSHPGNWALRGHSEPHTYSQTDTKANERWLIGYKAAGFMWKLSDSEGKKFTHSLASLKILKCFFLTLVDLGFFITWASEQDPYGTNERKRLSFFPATWEIMKRRHENLKLCRQDSITFSWCSVPFAWKKENH